MQKKSRNSLHPPGVGKPEKVCSVDWVVPGIATACLTASRLIFVDWPLMRAICKAMLSNEIIAIGPSTKNLLLEDLLL